MTILGILTSFSGGVFGALIGGTVSFIFTGILALMGTAVLLATGESGILDIIAFGPFFGPHIAFAGGVAASAYAGIRRKQLKEAGDDSYKLHPEGFDCAAPNFPSRELGPLVVGGVFGILGYVINELVIKTGIAVDTVAVAVVLTGVLSRVFIARQGLIGGYKEVDYEISARTMSYVFIWALAAGLLTSQAALTINVANIGWAISAVSLAFLYMNVDGFPVSHHVTMVAGYAAISSQNIYIGALAGGLAGVLGEVINKYTNTNVKAHVDMPAVTISIGSLIIFAIFG